MNVRPVHESDYDFVVEVINDWWGGRNMAPMVMRESFVSPHETSCVVEEDGQIIAFFLTSVGIDDQKSMWCNWIGVHPAHRNRGIGEMLYERFADEACRLGYQRIRAGTSIVNQGSIAFHTRIGFRIAPGDDVIGGIAVTRGSRTEPVVNFVKQL